VQGPVNPVFAISGHNACLVRKEGITVFQGFITRRRGTAAVSGSAARRRQLDHELSQEQALQIGAAGLGFFGVVLSLTVDRAFALLPALAFAALGQYAIQGWSPPMALFGWFGFRTSREIDGERYAAAAEATEPKLLEMSRAGAD
jgi:hypothetical protein